MGEFAIIYREDSLFAEFRALLTASFNAKSSVMHYLNMAVNNKRQWLERDEIKIKKYLYTIRPLLCAEWVLKHGSQPPMIYFELLDVLHPNSELSTVVRELVAIKQDMNELDTVPRNQVLSDWIDDTIESIQSALPEKQPDPEWAAYNAALRSICEQSFTAGEYAT